MAITYFQNNPPIHGYFSCQNHNAISLNSQSLNYTFKTSIQADSFAGRWNRRRSSLLIVSIGNPTAPMDPSTPIGLWLCEVLLHQPWSFYDSVSATLTDLAVDRDNAFDRMELSFEEPEAQLHRRIAELKDAEHFAIIEDIIYMIICKKFRDNNVRMIPSINKRVTNNRLEILPFKDEVLKSIHTPEAIEMIKEHIISVIGWNARPNTPITGIPNLVERLQLRKIYVTSIYYSYFLKWASLRHRLECKMFESYLDILPLNSWPFMFGSGFYGIRNIAVGEFNIPRFASLSPVQSSLSQSQPPKQFRRYVEGLDQDARRVCKQMKARMSWFLIQGHCTALFSAQNSIMFDYNDAFFTSFDSLRSLVLEAIVFGGFLWDAEELVDRYFNLRKTLR